MFSKSSALVTVAAAVGLSSFVQAQNVTGALGDLSASCQSAATGLLSTNFATCANVVGLVQVVSASGSVITPLNNWLNGLCPKTCAQSDLSTAQNSINSGCASDISGGNPLALGLQALTANYTTLKGAACLQSSSNSSYCITNLLGDAQTATGQQITLSYVEGLITGSGLTQVISSLPAGVLCTDCTKAIFNQVDPLIPSSSASAAKNAASGKCGAAFVNGQTPSTVKGASSSGSSSSTGGAASVPRLGALAVPAVAGSALLAFVGTGVFMVLA